MPASISYMSLIAALVTWGDWATALQVAVQTFFWGVVVRTVASGGPASDPDGGSGGDTNAASGGPGNGWLYAAPHVSEALQPVTTGWFGTSRSSAVTVPALITRANNPRGAVRCGAVVSCSAGSC